MFCSFDCLCRIIAGVLHGIYLVGTRASFIKQNKLTGMKGNIMGQLAIIVVIDIEAALDAGVLEGNTYLIDNNEWKGSTGEGTESLQTVIEGTQIMNWLIASIDIMNSKLPFPVLKRVSGEAVDMQIMVPVQFKSPELGGGDGLWWSATVDAQVSGIYAYTLELDIGGVSMNFTSHVNVKKSFSNVDE